jgi:Skp family chaperone for outer membrane proteins
MRPLHTLLCLAAACTLSAQEAPQPRIGIFVPDQVINQSVRGKKLFSELDALKKTLESKVQAKGQEMQKVQAQLQSPSISDSGKEALQKQLRDLDFDAKKLQDDAQVEYQKAQQKVVNQFQSEVGPLIEELAKEQKLQLVLQYQPAIVAYADRDWVVAFSNEIAKRYDAKYPTAGAAAKPAAPASAKPAPVPAPAAPKTN